MARIEVEHRGGDLRREPREPLRHARSHARGKFVAAMEETREFGGKRAWGGERAIEGVPPGEGGSKRGEDRPRRLDEAPGEHQRRDDGGCDQRGAGIAGAGDEPALERSGKPSARYEHHGAGEVEGIAAVVTDEEVGQRLGESKAVVEGAHDARLYFEPILEAPEGRMIVEPEEFYIFASKERIRVPRHLAAEMVAYDVGIGELRTNYAGFFDNGFGGDKGTRAVLEVRPHDVPFLLEDGQVFFKLEFFRTLEMPEIVYGDKRLSSHYQGQGLKLSKHFRI